MKNYEEGKSTEITLSVLPVKQPLGTFYIGSISAKELIKISEFDVRKLIGNDLDNYMGLQRNLSKPRMKDLEKYVNSKFATFPTGVIIAVDEKCAIIEEVNCEGGNSSYRMTLSNYNQPTDGEDPILFKGIARVLDGQHRISALMRYNQSDDFDVNLSIFIGSDIATQAEVFSIVNLAQTKVNRSLAYDLLAYSKTVSPEKTCHSVAVELNKNENSPFHRKIKRLGTATDGVFTESLTQSTFVKGLLQYISKDVIEDRDYFIRKKKIRTDESPKLVLRNWFEAREDAKIALIVWNYFDAVKERWPNAWASTGSGLVLNKSTGYIALMRFFRNAYGYFHAPRSGGMVDKDQFYSIFLRSNLKDEDFHKLQFVPGGSGQKDLYEHFLGLIE